MIERLLDLPEHQRKRLERALETGLLVAPFTDVAIAGAIGDADVSGELRSALGELAVLGISGRAAAAWIRTAAHARSSVVRPEIVWTGPEVPGVHARDTRQVFDDMLGSATQSIWASTYTYYDGPKAFELLAGRMDAIESLSVTLLINIARKWDDHRDADKLVMEFARRFWHSDWPGSRRPRVYFDRRSLESDRGQRGVLHAKALVRDESSVLVTSANFTEAALDRNIELGVKVADPVLAKQVVRYYRRLIELNLLERLPPS